MRPVSLPRIGKRLAVLVLGTLAACTGCEKKKSTTGSGAEVSVWPAPDLPDLARVEVSPATVHLHVPGSRQLEAVAFRANGTRFDPQEYPDLFKCAWSVEAPPPGTDRNPSGILVTLTEPAECGTALYVSSDTEVQTNLEIPIRLGIAGPAETSQEGRAALVVGAEDHSFSLIPSQTDWVQLPSSSDSTIVVISGCEERDNASPSTVDWLLYSGSGTTGSGLIDIKENLTLTGCSNPPEVDVFSSDQGAWILPESGLQDKGIGDLWTDEEEDELDLPALGYQNRDILDVFVYSYEDAGSDGLNELEQANKLFAKNLVGIQFNPVDAQEKDGCNLDPFPMDPCKTEFLKTCIGPEPTFTAAPPPLDIRLYVIFYRGVDAGNGGDWLGKTCKPADTEGAQVVFLPTERSVPETLAHEFGHVLGHRKPPLSWVSGHVHEYLPGFEDDPERARRNLMSTGGSGRDLLTVGQAYRMIVDLGSWYQVDPGLASVGRQPGRACGCNPYEGIICPQIHWTEGAEPVPQVGVAGPGAGAGGGGGP